jgi:hypothetical protein
VQAKNGPGGAGGTGSARPVPPKPGAVSGGARMISPVGAGPVGSETTYAGRRPRKCVRADGGGADADVRRHDCRGVTISSRPYFPYCRVAYYSVPGPPKIVSSIPPSPAISRPPRVRAYGVPESFREVDRAHRWVPDLGRATPSLRHAPSDTFSSD